MCSGERSSSANGAIAIRHASASGWSTSSSRVLSDWTINGPSGTQPVSHAPVTVPGMWEGSEFVQPSGGRIASVVVTAVQLRAARGGGGRTLAFGPGDGGVVAGAGY